MKRFLYILVLLTLITSRAFADAVTYVAKAPSTVEVGEKFRVQFIVNTQKVSDFSDPDFKGFEVMYGPSTSTQSSFQIINGNATQSSSITRTFMLQCLSEGTFTIAPGSVIVDGKTVKSNALKIKVLPSGQGGGGSSVQQGGGRSQSNAQQSRQSSSSGNISSNDLFMTATASRTRIYEQEAILLTYKVYTLVNLTQLEGKLPALDGFQIQEIPLSRNKEFDLEHYNGRNYRSLVWSQYVLFPQKSGDLVIPSVTYDGVVVVQNRNIDPFEAFFNGASSMMEVKKKITTPTLTIHVSPLPPKPANFSGAVGKFSIASSISTKEVDANDAVTLKVTLSGHGNMKLINTPEIEFPKVFETYDPKVNDKFALTHEGLSGSKDFEYLVVPRSAGDYTIPAVEFVYFDTDAKAYKTLKTEPYDIKVRKGKGGNAASAADYSNSQQDVKELASDIRYIKQGDVSLSKNDHTFFGSTLYIVSYVVLLLLAAIALIAGRSRMVANRDVARRRGKKANSKAVKRMKQAKKLLDAQNQGQFYDETLRALWGYISDKLNIAQEKLNKDNILSELQAQNVPAEHIDLFIKVLNDCEFARYAPGDASQNMQNIYDSAISVISKMEDNI